MLKIDSGGTEMNNEMDPRDRGPKPPFPPQHQGETGTDAQMQPEPDYGETSYRGRGKLSGKVALITGGDSGIGRAVALAYAREGANILFAYLESDQDADETTRLIHNEGRNGIAV